MRELIFPDKDVIDAFMRGLGSSDLKKKKIWLRKILQGKKDSFILKILTLEEETKND